MTLAMAIALAAVLNGGVANLIKIIEDLKASGHPLDKPVPDDVMSAMRAMFDAHTPEALAAMDALASWDDNHADNGN
jgi:hypothetical protein